MSICLMKKSKLASSLEGSGERNVPEISKISNHLEETINGNGAIGSIYPQLRFVLKKIVPKKHTLRLKVGNLELQTSN